MKIIGLLPARLKSSRIKQKLIQKVSGMPVILHTIFRAQLVKSLNKIIVCTDSKKLKILLINTQKHLFQKKNIEMVLNE